MVLRRHVGRTSNNITGCILDDRLYLALLRSKNNAGRQLHLESVRPSTPDDIVVGRGDEKGCALLDGDDVEEILYNRVRCYR